MIGGVIPSLLKLNKSSPVVMVHISVTADEIIIQYT